jgi:2-dehydro-3-deoxygalactonokinase
MIGIDWGTTSFRAYRLRGREVLDRLALPLGILSVDEGRFESALQDAVGPWLADGERRILMSGMIGSRQGWVEAPYLPCPAATADLARSLVPVPFAAAETLLVPGLSATDPADVPEVMRGEETQIVGALGRVQGDATVCLPGSHSKWVRVAGGRVEGFSTHLTGEAFAALRDHTILGRLMRADAPPDPEAFRRGVHRSVEPGGLLHHLFGIRTLGLFAQLAEAATASYLSGLLIGHEIRAAAPLNAGTPILLIGASALCMLYGQAIDQCGGSTTLAESDAAAQGLALIGEQAAWTLPDF